MNWKPSSESLSSNLTQESKTHLESTTTQVSYGKQPTGGKAFFWPLNTISQYLLNRIALKMNFTPLRL